MTRIENVNSRINLNSYCQPKRKNVSFRGAPSAKNVKNAEKIITEYLPPQVKVFQFFNKCKSDEATNILINAIGTAIFAPLMIAYNPISKVDKNDKQAKEEEKKTRHYSALRQPVSAVLAIITQIGVTKPIDKLLDYAANKGFLGKKCDFRLKNTTSFLTKQAKKCNAGMEKEEFSKLTKDQKKTEIKKWVENKSGSQVEVSIKAMKENGTIVVKGEDGKLEKMPVDKFYELMQKTAEDFKKDYLETAKAEYINERIGKQINRSKFILKDANCDNTVTNTINQALDIVKNNPPQRSGIKKALHSVKKGFVTNVMHKELKEPEFVKPPFDDLIKKLKKDGFEINGKKVEANPELIQMLEESQTILNKGAIIDKLEKIKAHVTEVKDLKTETNIINSVTNKVSKEYKNLEHLSSNWDNLIKLIKNSPQDKAGFDTIAKEGEKVAKENSVKFLDMVMEKHISNVEHIAKSNKSMVGLIMSLAMVPITCTMLNWAYPRFVDAFFPNLSDKKKGGN